MSRIGDCDDYDPGFPNEWAFWERRTRQVMSGKPMRKALVELREALLALPEKRLISRAFSTVGKAERRAPTLRRAHELLARGRGCLCGRRVRLAQEGQGRR
jgi:hypothetical protein